MNQAIFFTTKFLPGGLFFEKLCVIYKKYVRESPQLVPTFVNPLDTHKNGAYLYIYPFLLIFCYTFLCSIILLRF